MIRRLFINIPISIIFAIVLISQTIYARQLEWQWQNPLFQGNHLYALWASTNNQLIAGGALGTIITFDGNQWQEHHIETLQTIRSIWANDTARVAVGDMGQAIHFIDNEWQISTISQHPLKALWAINQDNIYAFGDAGTIFHYSGRSWKSEQSPTAANLIDAIGFGEYLFVVGTAGTFLYYDTKTWQVINPPKTVDFKGIWGSDQSNLFVCGTYLDANWHQNSCVYAFDGVNWKELGAFDSKVGLTHIWGDQNNIIYVSDDKGRIFKWQNSQWKEKFQSDQGIFRLAHMDNGFVAVGENGQFIRENNSIWYDDIDSPNQTINAIWGDSSHTFAVCQSGVILTMQNHSWHFHSQPINNDLNDISGDDHTIFVAGESGFIATFGGQVFTPIETPTNSDIFAISVKDNTVIAVGERGLIMHYENNIWKLKKSPTTQTLYDVWTDTGDCAYAVGKNGTVIFFNGTSWQSMETPTTERLYSVWGSGPTQVFAAGKYGSMIQFDGHQWHRVNNFPTSDHIMSMWGQGNRFFATGDNGALCAYDGTDWQLIVSPCALDIHTVWGRSDTDIYIGGANGIILHYPYQVKKTIDLIIANTISENHGILSGQLLVSPVSEKDLFVQLQSSSSEQLIVPRSLIVPSGYTMVQFEMTVVDNRKHDGQKYVNIEAKAESFSPSVASITINDDESDRGIWVIDHFPRGKTPTPIDHINLRFNRDIDIQSFDRDDLVITGPQGHLALKENFEWNQNTVSLFFDSQEITGNYTIYVGPDISGNDDTGMDQDGDEQFFEIHDDVYVGHFLLEDQTGPYVVARSPNERIKGPIPNIIIEFNEEIEASSLSIHDISMVEENGTQIIFDQIVKQSDKRYVIIPKISITSGSYTFKIGPEISDLAGNFMNQDQDSICGELSDDHYECKFIIDQQGPRIFFHSLFGKQNNAISLFDLTFNEAILASTLTMDTLSFSGSEGPLPIERIQQISVDVYRIFISPQYYDGIFEIRLQPTITDLAGNFLDQDNNGIGGEESDRFELSFQQELADLRVTQIEFAPEAQPGANIEINWIVWNNGMGATSSIWQDEIYLSEDPYIGDDTFVTAVDNQMILNKSEHYFRSVSIPVPDKNETHHWVIIKTNPGNSQDENNFDNNQTISAYPFWNTQRAYPDLFVNDVFVPQTIYVGEPVSIAWEVVNQGNGPTSATVWMDRVILSTDNVLDDQDIEIARFRNPDFLSSGEKYQKEHEVVLLPDIIEDTYYVFVHTDANDQVEEFDQESNNLTTVSVPVSVQIPSPGQLIVTSFLAPDQVSPGDNIQLTWTVYNVGESTIDSTSHMILLSKNKQVDPENDAILFWTNAENYLPGHSYTLSYPVRMPSLIEMGSYYLIPASNKTMYLGTPVAVPITVTSLVFPDLMVSNDMTFPDHIETDQLLTISWQVVNIGQGKTLVSNWLDYVYLSTDQIKDEDDIFLGSSRHEKILDANNGQVHISKTFKIPEHLNGNYYVCVHTDALQSINESAENNNMSFSHPQIHIQQKQTDLTVVSATAPYSAITGQSAHFQWSVKNIGMDPCIKNSWIDRVFLSSNERLDENDILLGEIAHTSILEAEEIVEKSLTASIPALMDGHYYAIILVDAQDTIYEADAGQNNIFVIDGPIHVHHLFPDLRIETINTADSPVYANETMAISYTLINDGQTDTYGQWRDRFYLSQDSHLDTETDPLIGVIEHQDQILAGSSMCIQSDQLMIPAQISGMYTIFVQVDALNQLYEYQGENNNQAALSVEIADSPADLKVINIQAPIKVDAGTAIHVSWDVMNMGRQDTQEAFWYDRIYLSRDNILSPTYDIELGNIINKQPLKAGEKYTSAHYFVIRQDLGGTYNILVQTDAQNQVYENNHEDNNIRQAQTDILLVGVYVDLIASDLQFNQNPWAGQSIEVSWTVTNEGFDPTHVSSWEDIIYLSNDPIPDVNDTVLGVYQHNGALASGETYHKSKTVQIPKDLFGTYYFIVKTDANVYNDVYENQAEENNFVFDEIVVDTSPTPNLRVTNLNIPSQVWSGQYLRIEWSFENNGEMTVQPESGFWYDSVYLSRDPFLDIVHDIPVGNVRFDGTLASHSRSYTQVLETMLPPGISGPYYVIVLADSSIPRHVYESNRDDNVFISNYSINIQLTPPSDLLVTHLITPDTGMPGQMLEWQFVVKNNGLRPAVGAWYDTLYLSSDDIWDIDDYRIARYYQHGDISTGNAYTAVVHAKVPTAISGKYHVIVRSDILNDIRETNEQNNLYVSSRIMEVENTILNCDDTIQDHISSGALRYYQINIQQDEDIEIVLNGPAASCCELLLGNNYIPRRSQYDRRGVLMNDSLILNQSDISQGIYYLTLYGLNCDDLKPFELSLNYLVNLRIHDLSISKATNIGMTTLQIEGAHFQPEIDVRLTRDNADLNRVQSVNVLNSGQISLTLDLNDLPEGTYHIVLQNPDNETAKTAFEVVNEKRGELFARLLIPGYVTQNKIYQFTLEYGNVGHSDILAPLLVISAGDGGLLRRNNNDEFSDNPIQILGISDLYPVDVLPPDTFYTVKFEFMLVSEEYVPFYIQIMDQPDEPIDWNGLHARLKPERIDDNIWEVLFGQFKTNMGKTWGDYVNRLRQNAVENAFYGTTTHDVQSLLPNFSAGRSDISIPLPIPPGTRRTSGGSIAPDIADVHDKLTSIGTGTLHHILFDGTIEYTIRFENKSTANASAQYIQIDDLLHEQLDLDTFELKEIEVGGNQLDIPSGHSYYHTRMDLRPTGQNIFVDIEAGIDYHTRMARWIFTAIDPKTGEQSEDPLNGFLPPNETGNKGEGLVRFQIKPRSDIESGTIINNMATIIFDRNEPVDTPIAYNTVDLSIPESKVKQVSPPHYLEISISWGGQDTRNGSGISTYDIYISDNEQPYELWLSQTKATSGIYIGNPGHTYSFYSIATDKVGNVESAPLQPDVVVKLDSNLPPDAPVLISTENNAAPVLKTSEFNDSDSSSHMATRWQISKTNDFSMKVLDIESQIFLTELHVPYGVLSALKKYYWRACHIDSFSSASDWSEIDEFTTTVFDLPVITDNTIDLDQNGASDISQTNMALIQIDSKYLSITSHTDDVSIVTASSIENIFGDFPADMPYGLISFRATCPVGAEIDVQMYFSEKIPFNASWYKFDYNNGFIDYSAHTEKNLPGNTITVQLKDGGFGDADGVENGVVIDPGGIGIWDADDVIAGDDSSNCFIRIIQF
jgi:subtilase family serine protease